MERQKYIVEILVDDIGLNEFQGRKVMGMMNEISDLKLDKIIDWLNTEASLYPYENRDDIEEFVKSLKSKQNG